MKVFRRIEPLESMMWIAPPCRMAKLLVKVLSSITAFDPLVTLMAPPDPSPPTSARLLSKMLLRIVAALPWAMPMAPPKAGLSSLCPFRSVSRVISVAVVWPFLIRKIGPCPWASMMVLAALAPRKIRSLPGGPGSMLCSL